MNHCKRIFTALFLKGIVLVMAVLVLHLSQAHVSNSTIFHICT